tara:strand:+ start:1266 stop:1655 length:390 start_codon:yes stop_codon:yes gene_type:complete
MSTLNVANITDGTDTVATGYVINGSAKAAYGVNQKSTTNMGIATDTTSSQSTNISSYTDDGTGIFSLALTNAMSNTQYVFLSGALSTNNMACLREAQSTASILALKSTDADTSLVTDALTYGTVFGDLA